MSFDVPGTNPMNLLFHQSALGDLVLTFPMLRAIGGEWAVIAGGDKAAMTARVLGRERLEMRPFDIEMFEFRRLYQAGGPTALSPAVREVLDAAAMVISFVSDGRDAWAENMERLAGGATRVYLDPRPPGDWEHHVTRWYRERAAEQGLRWGVWRRVGGESTAGRGGCDGGASRQRRAGQGMADGAMV